MKVIKRRGYVAGESGRGPLIPETRGRLVSSFLAHFFDEYVDYGFTAGLEDRLDDIASGKEDWKSVLSGFWGPFAGDVESLKGIRTSQVVDVLDATLGAHFFGDDESSVDARLSAIERAAEEAATQAESTGGYPTVAFVANGKSTIYQGPRTSQAFSDFARQQATVAKLKAAVSGVAAGVVSGAKAGLSKLGLSKIARSNFAPAPAT